MVIVAKKGRITLATLTTDGEIARIDDRGDYAYFSVYNDEGTIMRETIYKNPETTTSFVTGTSFEIVWIEGDKR